MHIIKNIFENLYSTLLNIPRKIKKGIKVRQDMVEMGMRSELAPIEEDGKQAFLLVACYMLSRKEKLSLLRCLNSIKVPIGYFSNISSKVSIGEMKLIGLKSHDCHVLLTQLLPVTIREILLQDVRHSITKLCFFFNKIYSKVINPNELDALQRDVVATLCEFEMFFPHLFF
jgi:hypothetical protein